MRFIPIKNRFGLARRITSQDLRKYTTNIKSILEAEGEEIEKIESPQIDSDEKEIVEYRFWTSTISTKNIEIQVESGVNRERGSMFLQLGFAFLVMNMLEKVSYTGTTIHGIDYLEMGKFGAAVAYTSLYYVYLKNKYTKHGLEISTSRTKEGDIKRYLELTDLLDNYNPNYL